MSTDSNPSFEPVGDPTPRRLFLAEPGWRVGMKDGSTREFCYMMAPAQDYYHRLYDGEFYLQRGDERLCLACAERRGLIRFEPKGLRDPINAMEYDVDESATGIELHLHDEIDR
jgi:hypothetical protein